MFERLRTTDVKERKEPGDVLLGLCVSKVGAWVDSVVFNLLGNTHSQQRETLLNPTRMTGYKA